MFFTEIFHLLVEQTNFLTPSNTWDRQAWPYHQPPDITMPDMKTFRWDTNWKTHYMITLSRLKDSYTIHFKARPWHDTDFHTNCIFCILQAIHRDMTKVKNMTDYGH